MPAETKPASPTEQKHDSWAAGRHEVLAGGLTTALAASRPARQCSLLASTDCSSGNDIAHSTQPSAEACLALCEATPGCCTGKYDSKHTVCYLKHGGWLKSTGDPFISAFNCTPGCQAPDPPPPPPRPLPPPAPTPPAHFHDMSKLVGAEYTPWRATSQLWWHNYTEHRPDVVREVKAMRAVLGFTSVRMFLHDMVFVDNATRLEANMDDFLAILAAENMTAGFVFFDDCWNHAGANLSVTCVPRQGIHNDCWFACPQDVERTSIAKFEPYVASIVKRFAKDERVAWWEIFNEPQKGSNFSMALRDAAFGWAKGQDPAAPILSCWDDNNDTEVVDTHEYSPPTDQSPVFSNPAKGGIVTEAGCRWYQSTHDYGAPLSWTTWLMNIQDGTDKTAPFAPGVMLSWEVMVGHSMTRYHWGLPVGTPEPAIPWCGSLYPDGSPVSYTEAAAIRRYTTGADDFYFLFVGRGGGGASQPFLTVASGKTWTGWAPAKPTPAGGALYELTLFTEAGDGSVEVTAGGHKIALSITDTPRKCTTTGYLGCFKEGKRPGWILPTFPPNQDRGVMTNEVCASLCKDASFSPFPNCGTERGRLCMCGTVNTTKWPVDEKLCRVPCPGNKSETCGGEPAPGGTGDAVSAYAMTWAPQFGGRNVSRPRKRKSSFFSIKTGCADTVPVQPKPNTPF